MLIGLGSKARQGKDIAGQAIVDYYNEQRSWARKHGLKVTKETFPKACVFKFATALYQEVNDAIKNGVWDRRVVSEVINLNPTQKPIITRHSILVPNVTGKHYIPLPEWVEPEPNPEVSELAPYGKHPKLLQWWGTEYRRAQNPNYWVEKLYASIPDYIGVAVITDVRFLNEAESIKEHGGHTVKVSRFTGDGVPYLALDRPVDHPSETALDDYSWDFRLVNTHGHQALLEEQAITVAEYIRGLES